MENIQEKNKYVQGQEEDQEQDQHEEDQEDMEIRLVGEIQNSAKVPFKTLVQERRQMVSVLIDTGCSERHVVVALDALTPSEQKEAEKYWKRLCKWTDEMAHWEDQTYYRGNFNLPRPEHPKLTSFLQRLKDTLLVIYDHDFVGDKEYRERLVEDKDFLDLNKRLWPTTYVLNWVHHPQIVVTMALDLCC